MKNGEMKLKKIMMVGAGYLQLKTIQLIKKLGYECICIDGNPEAIGFELADEHLCIDILNIDACVAYAKEKRIDGVTTASATITLPAVAAIGKEMNLISIDCEVVEILRNKYKIKKKLFENGLNNSGFFANISTEALVNQVKEEIQYPAIIKPSDGSGSKGIRIVNHPDELLQAIEYALQNSRIKDIYIEKFIEGQEYGVECFVFNGEIIIYGVIKQTFKKDINNQIEYGHCIPSGLPLAIEEKIKDEVKRAINCLGINHGSVNMDIILSKDNIPYIIDVGARIGLNQIAERMVPLSTGVNILENTIKACVQDEAEFSPQYSRPIASRLLIFRPGTIKHIGEYKKLIDGKNVLDIIIKVKEGDKVNPYKVKADTCGWVITTADTVEEAEKLANEIKDKIESLFEYE